MFGNNPTVPLALTALGAGILALSASLFAVGQAIWLDETTQLLGLTLDFGEQYRWLTGRSDVVLGVPPDRMPPLSYWLGGLWAQVFGLSEMALRAFGILAVAASAPALFLTGRRVAGSVGGVFLVWLLLPAPAALVIAGEIRAYPLFLAFSIWAVWAFVRLAFPDENQRQWRDFGLLILFSVLMSYTHYFGVVASGSLFAGLFVQRIMSRQAILPVLAAGLLTLALLGGLWPFIAAAIDVSGTLAADSGAPQLKYILVGLARLSLRLLVHPVLLASTPVLVLFLGCLLVLGLGAVMALTSVWKDQGRAGYAVVVPPLLALVSLGALKPLIRGFEMLSTQYSIWLMPVVGLGLCMAFQNREAQRPWRRITTGVAAVGIIAGNLFGLVTVLGNGSLYSHGPGEWIAQAISGSAETAETLVIHDGQGPWGHSYFPLFYLSGGETEQWLRAENGDISRITATGIEPVSDPDARQRDFTRVYQVVTRTMNSQSLANIASGTRTCSETFGLMVPEGTEGMIFCAAVSASISEIPRVRD